MISEKKILIFGITGTSIKLYDYLKSNNTVVLWDIIDTTKLKSSYNITDNLENVKFDDYNYIILSKDILIVKEDFDTLKKRLLTIKDKVFLDIEFIQILFPDNKYLGIVGSGYNYITNYLIKAILETNNTNNFICSAFTERNNYKLSNHDFEKAVISISIRDAKVDFIKQLNFNILALLDIEDKKEVLDILLNRENSILILNVDNISNEDFISNTTINSKIIPISTTKMLKNGISYIGGTIYDYYDNKNDSYDIGNGYIGDITKTSILCSFVIAKNCGIDTSLIKEVLSEFNGLKNCLEKVGQIENITFINNIEANNKNILLSPYDTYSNIYSIVLVNGKQSENELPKKFTGKIFLVDFHNLSPINNIHKFDNLKNAFTAALAEARCEEKETEITILLTPIVGDDMNSVYYATYGEEFRNLFKEEKE